MCSCGGGARAAPLDCCPPPAPTPLPAAADVLGVVAAAAAADWPPLGFTGALRGDDPGGAAPLGDSPAPVEPPLPAPLPPVAPTPRLPTLPAGPPAPISRALPPWDPAAFIGVLGVLGACPPMPGDAPRAAALSSDGANDLRACCICSTTGDDVARIILWSLGADAVAAAVAGESPLLTGGWAGEEERSMREGGAPPAVLPAIAPLAGVPALPLAAAAPRSPPRAPAAAVTLLAPPAARVPPGAWLWALPPPCE